MDFTIPLAGGALFTWNATNGYEVSHTNWHGDTVTVTDLDGHRVWTGITGPHGERASATDLVNTGMDGVRWGWHGADQRMTDRTITQMGARAYSLAHGRFLSVDPTEGGCANDYTYVFGDPLNADDIYGEWWRGALKVVSVAAPVLGCMAGPAGCAVGAGIGYAARRAERVHDCGWGAGLFSRESAGDFFLTAATAGLFSAPLRAAKEGMAVTGGFRMLLGSPREGASRLLRSGALSWGASGAGALPAGMYLARSASRGNC